MTPPKPALALADRGLLRGELPLLAGVTAAACVSDCGTYRYWLTRYWGNGDADTVNSVAFVMLNPSAASHSVDDRTIRKCQAFACAWGHNGLTVVNLFALRATSPEELRRHADPVGPHNDDHIERCVLDSSRVVVAWGAHGAFRSRGLIVLDRLCQLGVSPLRLGSPTKGGHPRHPLRGVPLTAALEPACSDAAWREANAR